MGVEPTDDIARCRPPVLKTGTITGLHALPRCIQLNKGTRCHPELCAHHLCLAYSPAPIKCNETYGSSPTTQLSWPGSM